MLNRSEALGEENDVRRCDQVWFSSCAADETEGSRDMLAKLEK